MIIYCDIYKTNNLLLMFITKKKIKSAPSLFTITETIKIIEIIINALFCDITDFYRTGKYAISTEC